MTTIQRTVQIEIVWCCSCGNPIALTERMEDACRNDGHPFYCPLGHSQVFRKSAVTVLQEKLDMAQALATRLETKVRNTEALLEVESKARKMLAKRVNNGVCPHCHRTFQQVARHMKSKHPDKVGV